MHIDTTPEPAPPAPAARARRALGMPQLALIGLALLAVPRVILHDLGLTAEGTLVNLLLVVAPIAIWIGVALLRRVPNPFLTLLTVGFWYGVFLVLAHQLLWDVAFGQHPPQLGGNLAGLDPVLEAVIVRTFAAASGLVTGLAVGAASGAVAWLLAAAARRVQR